MKPDMTFSIVMLQYMFLSAVSIETIACPVADIIHDLKSWYNEDEFHFILECPKYDNIRKLNIERY